MTTPPPQDSFKNKGAKTERQKRLGSALRENLRKRKNQTQERQKSQILPEKETEPKV